MCICLLATACCQSSSIVSDDDAQATQVSGEGARTVTLITGDVVRVAADGSVVVQPGQGRERIGFITHRVGAETTVIPHDVAELVAAGQLDRALFSVTQLLAEGYDDARRDDLPLILTGVTGTGPSGMASARRRISASGLTVARELPALRAMAVHQRKAATRTVLDDLRTAPAQKLWLDRRLKLVLDHSVPQIGAPAAWSSGYTGAGVVVAVLDTGIDAEHPDLAGKVLDAESFVDDARGESDVVGHGTHVASIIAGSGAASAGLYRGVAPDAALISGRVCGVDGCPFSAVLAGMEWAVVAKQAKVINMSLGAPDGPGEDPLEQAVNQLSAQYGVLFVVAAGNVGVPGSVGSPGSADAALTVGAVDRDDQRALFSSQGPRVGDHAIKPDVTAPGVSIIAARAAAARPEFGEPVGTDYLRLSGTSMATPHVAGAAALLVQQHAGWTGAQLKAALMGSANPHAAQTVFQQGAGRVDVARATQQAITAEPASLSLGLASWPHDDDPVVRRTVTYRNDGAVPLTLALTGGLASDGAAAPGMLGIEPASLVVPAGGSADVVVTVDTTGDRPDGMYSGALMATASGVRVVTPLAIEREREGHNVTVEVLDSQGKPTRGMAVLDNFDNPRESVFFRPPATVRVTRGLYGLTVTPFEFMAMHYPRLDVTRDMTIVLDGRDARPVDATVAGVALQPHYLEVGLRDVVHDIHDSSGSSVPFLSAHFGPAAAPGELHSYAVLSAVPEGQVDGRSIYMLGHRERDRAITGWTETIAADRLATVHARHRGEPDRLYQKYAGSALDGLPSQYALGDFMHGAAIYTGAFERTEHYFGDGFRWGPALEQMVDFDGFLDRVTETGRVLQRYRPGQRYVEDWGHAPFGPAFSEHFGASTASRVGDELRIAASLFSEVSTPSRTGLALGAQHVVLYRDGQVIVDATDSGLFLLHPLRVPPAPATYRLEQEATRPPEISELSSRVTAAWTFTSGHVDGREPRTLSLPTLRFTPALDEHNRARRAFPLVLPVEIERPLGAPTPAITDVSVEASFDDGATWKRVVGARIGARWLGLVIHPANASYVSLRGSARDVDGNRVEQTIIRAYKLAP